MKKFIALILMLGLASPAFSASQWDKANPAGTTNVADLDYYIATVNNEAQDRLKINYRLGCAVIPNSVATTQVLAGEIAIPNSDGSVVRYRRNTSATSVTWSDIDTGVEASSTQYYVWAIADSDVTTFTIKISTSSSAPSSATYYRKIGYFYNNSSGDIVSVGNIMGGDVSNIIQAIGTSDITTTSSSYTDMTDMVVYFVSTGRPVEINYTAPHYKSGQGPFAVITVDGTEKVEAYSYPQDLNTTPITLKYLEALSSGTHTIKIQWKVSSGTAYQRGATDGDRVLTVEEK